MSARTLALLGGAPAVPRELRKVVWPVVTADDEAAVLRVLASGDLVAISPRRTEVDELEDEWGAFVGVDYCVAVSSGTAALSLSLAAAGIEPGDEVLVPALTFAGSALAVLHVLAVPVFVDIDPATFTIDVECAEAAITERTRAVMPVHLHGLPADMHGVRRMAEEHGLLVVEDAAQAHGARYGGARCGALGRAGAFSLNVSKNLPTCGEGGLLTTDDAELAARARAMRQFGETFVRGAERRYVSEMLGWNHKPSAVQTAFTRSQLRRFGEYQQAREANVTAFLDLVGALPGVVTPHVPEDRWHAWHIIRLRFDPVAAGAGDVPAATFRAAVQRALVAEGVGMSRYQRVPLPDQPVFRDRSGYGRGLPWGIARDGVASGGRAAAMHAFPQTRQVIQDSLTIQRWHLSPESGPLLRAYAEAMHKVWDNLEVIEAMTRSAVAASQRPPG